MGSAAILFHIIFALLITLVVAFEATLDENQTLKLLYQELLTRTKIKLRERLRHIIRS